MKILGKIVHVELKLYAEGGSEDKSDLENEVMSELNRIFRKSSNLILSSIKSVDIIKGIDINFKENKLFQNKMIRDEQLNK